MRDLLSDLNNYAWPANEWYASDTANDVSAFSVISSPYSSFKHSKWWRHSRH